MTVPCLCHLQHSFDKHIKWDILSIHGIKKTVSWLPVVRLLVRLLLRLAVTVYNCQFAVLHSGAFVWSTSQH